MSQSHRNTNEHDQRLKKSQASHLPEPPPPPIAAVSRRSGATSLGSQKQRTLHHEPALRRAAPSGLSDLRPLPRAARLRLVGEAPPKAQDRRRFSGQKSKSESSLRRTWHVEHAGLPGRPDDFPLSKGTSRVVSARADAISNRISECLQSRSIKTKFSKSDDGNNIAECRNTDFCKFTIGLYAAEDDGVLVEVHRVCGDCISFMKDCRAILNASEGKTEPSPSDKKPLYLRLPEKKIYSEDEGGKTEPSLSKEKPLYLRLPEKYISPEDEGDYVGIMTELLSSRQSDTNMLGMESLVFQTDPLQSLKSEAGIVSRMILCHDDPGNKPFNVHNYVMSLIIYDEDDALEDHASKLRSLAMSALSNALTLFAAEDLLSATIAPYREWYAAVLIPKLLQGLSTSARRPFDACYASRCLSTLAESSVEFADAMKDAGGHEAVSCAHEVGAREFAMLARDAGRYRNVLMSCCA